MTAQVKCGVPNCHHSAKLHGVCGVHKKKAFHSEDPKFLSDLEDYRSLMREFVAEEQLLSARRINILSIQEVWDHNLCQSRSREFPPHFRRAGELMESLPRQIEQMKLRHDPYLVWNACMRVNHSFQSPACRCPLCGLK